MRLVAPRFDGADALPRQGIPVIEYQRLAEEFVTRLGLQVQWVYVDAFADLIPTLLAGEADLIVTNMTETDDRREQVNFSRAINMVDEVVITGANTELSALDQLAGLNLAVLENSAFEDSLVAYNNLAESQVEFRTLPSSLSNAEILDQLVDGAFEATVLDSNMAAALLPEYDSLHTPIVLRKNRPIGWAARQDNPELLRELNEFLVSHFLSFATIPDQHRDWDTIKDHGRLRLITTNSPASYFMWRGDVMGFDYDLAKRFASNNNLHLSIVLKDSIADMFAALKAGEGDFIAASITPSEERRAQGLAFSRPYLYVTEQLVGRTDGPSVESVEELTGMRVGVNPDTVFYRRLQALQDADIALELVEYPGVSTEALFRHLADGEFDFMMADSHLAAVELVHGDELKINLDLGSESTIAFVTRPDQPQLNQQLSDFAKKEYRGLFYNVTYDKYFVNQRKIRARQADRVTSGSKLSPYDDTVKEIADRYGMDWRLVTAQMFQESRFDPNARSFAGARGLMQVVPRTAREMGFTDLHDPATGIEAGVAYLDWLEGRFPGDIDFQERIYFQLAAYNAGAGHVRDARRLAQQLDYDPNIWFNNVENAMLLLSQKQYYQKARFGYVRGSEPVDYVRAIRHRYLTYLGIGE